MRSKLVLLSDDESHILHVVGSKLRGAGFDVITARDGEEGLSLAMEHRPDMIFTDYQMPGMNGIELCQRLRDDDAMRDTPVVLLTGQSHQISDSTMCSLNITANISKPFSPRLIIEIAERCAAQKNQDSPA